MSASTKLAAKDFATEQEVRWCPGCGDYAVLKAVRQTLADIGARPENTVFVSGIGCSSRLPYYMATYGFHTIHGRAPAVATGVKLSNPALDIWIITGDGDGLSIGGNHTMHLLRRNIDCQLLLFNNEIYGLTKGQSSPTSRIGTRSPSTPLGSVDRPVNPCAFALGSGARFIARGIDTSKHLPEILRAAHAHKGASFVEIFQNCIVFNHDVFADFTADEHSANKQLWLKRGEPMLFAGGTKGIGLDRQTLSLTIIDVYNGTLSNDVLVHDPTKRTIAHMLIEMGKEFPVALGTIYEDPLLNFDDALAKKALGHPGTTADLQALLAGDQTWEVVSTSDKHTPVSFKSSVAP